MRLFIAFDIPDDIKNKILDLEREILKKTTRIRLIGKDNMHITLKFMGEQPFTTLEGIVSILTEEVKKHSHFYINLERAGIFKDLLSPRVLWLGEDNEKYNKISKALNEKLDIFRPSDNDPFCHLTIGRIKRIDKRELLDVLKICNNFLKNTSIGFEVKDFYLYESKLQPKGAIYKKIEKFNLR